MRRFLSAAVLVCGFTGAALAAPLDIDAQPIVSFKTGIENSRFGVLEFMGGLRLTSGEPLFGAWSSIRFRPDGRDFVGVLDTGHWFTGTLVRDPAGRIVGIRDADISEMLDRRGRPSPGKSEMDSESLALVPGGVAVGFEQRHRIDLYTDPGFAASRPIAAIDPLIPVSSLRHNGSLETLALSPASSPLGGALVVVSENSTDRDGNVLAAILGGPLKGRFSVRRTDEYAITDGAFLPDGDLLILERRFSLSRSIGMRIRRIPGEAIRPGSVADGEVLIDVDFSHRIDNMEGLDVVEGPDGQPRIIVISDDNHSIFQNTLMLEFRFAD
ncbi:esterase-like activity of phytase family protein [Rhizobiaceae bacterium BDR2-2]|uniref:Esterase-like activity of phytase family protein n=1 Tax=Ectorhizobium quercum TaxID=2965071 RepID=A0AAE3SWJ0_9HYPH|nr:esterase-like activity of phytase family protein [Ectorhizobium quercum]MCX8999202.1 esterase-like activity of phytase family protein [Ectorhizobium quercum]